MALLRARLGWIDVRSRLRPLGGGTRRTSEQACGSVSSRRIDAEVIVTLGLQSKAIFEVCVSADEDDMPDRVNKSHIL